MGIIQNLLEKGFSAFYKKISFLPQSFSTKEFSAYEPDASDTLLLSELFDFARTFSFYLLLTTLTRFLCASKLGRSAKF